MSKKKSKTEEGELMIGSPALATGSEPAPEVAPPPLPDTPPPLPEPAPTDNGLSTHEPQLASVAPVASVVVADPALDERLRRLEAMLSQVPNLQALEQRVNQIQQAPVATPASIPVPAASSSSGASSVLNQARALFTVGRHLLPALPAGEAPPKPRGWLVWEMIAELRAMACMYIDPRYKVAWSSYVLPPALILAFLTTKWWFPFGLTLKELGMLWLLTPVDVLLLYCMFKILGHEARRYRETAPDLPPSLRL